MSIEIDCCRFRSRNSCRISASLFENQRRSIAMLPVGAPALNRDEALEVLEQLVKALRELRRRNDGR